MCKKLIDQLFFWIGFVDLNCYESAGKESFNRTKVKKDQQRDSYSSDEFYDLVIHFLLFFKLKQLW